MLRLRTIIPVLTAASLGASCPGPLADASIRAAEPYRPEIWNGKLSNQKLADIFNRHSAEIEIMAAREFEGHARTVFPRKAHAPFEKVSWAISRAKTAAIWGETPRSMSLRLGINEKALANLLPELQEAEKWLKFQNNSNCYAYSVNFADKYSKDGNPGDRTLSSPFDWQALAYDDFKIFVNKVIEGATSDGLIYIGAEAPAKHGFYRIAFYARRANPDFKEETKLYQSNEFHFARQNRDGTWSHKYGGYNVMNTDYSGRIITDAKKADMGDYRFIGYFMAPEGGIKVGKRIRFVLPAHKPQLSQISQKTDEIIVSAPRPAR